MQWSNDLVKFIINKAQEHGVRVYFYTAKDDTLLITMATEIDKDIIILLREEIALYLSQMGYKFMLKVSSHKSELRVIIKDGVLSE